jgi:hypothetical protein
MRELFPKVPNNPIMRRIELYWLLSEPSWADAMVAAFPTDPHEVWQSLVELANFRLDGVESRRLDRSQAKVLPTRPPGLAISRVRRAVLGSATVDHLLPGLRRGLWFDTFTPDFGQYTGSHGPGVRVGCAAFTARARSERTIRMKFDHIGITTAGLEAGRTLLEDAVGVPAWTILRRRRSIWWRRALPRSRKPAWPSRTAIGRSSSSVRSHGC